MIPNHIIPTPKALITTSPTPAALILGRQASSKKYEYPACRTDPSGPCALSDRAKELCSREFATWSNGGYPREYYCQCTNGYYARSSECWNDCYGASRTTQDLESISRNSRMQQLECESWSLQIDSQEARTSLTGLTGNRTSVHPSTTSSAYQVDVSIPSVGATASANVEETAPWGMRPSATGQVQQGIGASNLRHVGWSGLHSLTFILALKVAVGF